MKRRVPGREPGVFPLVRHRQDLGRIEVPPFVIAPLLPAPGRCRPCGVAGEPLAHRVDVALLVPQHPGECLALNVTHVRGERKRRDAMVEIVCLPDALREDRVEPGAQRRAQSFRVAQAQLDGNRLAGADQENIVGCGLGAGVPGIHRFMAALHDEVVDPVLHVRCGIGHAEEAFIVRHVFREERLTGRVAMQPEFPDLRVCGLEHQALVVRARDPDVWLRRARIPRPGVPEPERGEHVQGRCLGAAIGGADPDQDVLRRVLRVFHEHVEVAVVVEDSGIEKLVLRIVPPAPPVLIDEIRIGIGPLRVLVQVLHVGMARDVVEVEVVFLHVLAVIALVSAQTEQTLLENGICAVPERKREAEVLPVVRDSRDAVLAPAVGARAGLIVSQIFPRRTIGTVVLAHRAPLPLAEVGTPAAPWRCAGAGFLQSLLFRRHRSSFMSPVATRARARGAGSWSSRPAGERASQHRSAADFRFVMLLRAYADRCTLSR